MKLDPGFMNHWKTERLIDELGAEAVVAVLRLWGSAQIRRTFSGLQFTPKRLAMETKWKGSADQLFAVLTDPDAPWLDRESDGTFTIHGFSEHQHQVIKLWENGKKGGRPKKVIKETYTSSSSSSSSSPICEPNENQMVLIDAASPSKNKAKGTLKEMEAFALGIGLPASDGENCFHKWESTGWDSIKDWKSKMRSWKTEGYHASQKQSGKSGATPQAGTHIIAGRTFKS
jgi:hypothetical protein